MSYSTRVTFESAYANLEQTVRNYNRDKLRCEETIRALETQIKELQKMVNDCKHEIELLSEENRKLVEGREEDRTAKYSVEALISTVAAKQDLMSKSLTKFELAQEEVACRFEHVNEFMDNVKIRQIQLNQWIESLKEEIAALETEKQRTLGQLTGEFKKTEKLKKELQEKEAKLSAFENEHAGMVKDLSFRIETLDAEKQNALDKIFQEAEKAECLMKEVKDKDTKLEELKLSHCNITKALNSNIDVLSEEKQKAMDNLIAKTETIDCLKEKLRDSETKYSELLVFNRNVSAELETRLQELETQKQKFMDKLAKETNNVEQLRQDLRDREASMLELKNSYQNTTTALNNQAESLSSEKQILLDKLTDKTANVKHLTNELNAKNVTLSENANSYNIATTMLNARIKTLDAERQNVLDKLTAEAKIVEHLKQELSIKEATLLQLADTHHNALAELNIRIEHLEAEKREASDKLAQETQRVECFMKLLNDKETRMSELMDSHQTALNALNTLIEASDAKKLNVEIKLAEETARIECLMQELQDREAKLSELTELYQNNALALNNRIEILEAEKQKILDKLTEETDKVEYLTKELKNRDSMVSELTEAHKNATKALNLIATGNDNESPVRKVHRPPPFRVPASFRTSKSRSILKTNLNSPGNAKTVSWSNNLTHLLEGKRKKFDSFNLETSSGSSDERVDSDNGAADSTVPDKPKKRVKLFLPESP